MINTKQKYFTIPFLLAFLCLSFVGYAQSKIPDIPTEQTSVYDGANLLNGIQKSSLERKLINYSDTTSTQIVVATVKTINGENIALYATEWAHKWKIGQEKEDNGIFILVAKDDRKLTIRTGYGIEHLLTDALSKRIIEQVITPAFKQGDYYHGLDKGTTVIMQIMSGEYQGTRESDDSPFPFIFMLLFFIILVIILVNISKRGGGNRSGRRRGIGGSILEAIILSKQGRGGFGGSSSSGGSFGGGGGFGGGFGGGGFGGGGASGGW